MTQAPSVALVSWRDMAHRNWESVLSSRERFEASTYSNLARRERSVTSRVVAKYLITTQLATAFQRTGCSEIASAGSPEWPYVEVLSGTAANRATPRVFCRGNACDGVSASSSHCGPYTASLLARRRAGIDLERVESRRPEFYANMFSAAERKWVSAIFGSVRTHEAFTILWTVKEAFLKASGRHDFSIWKFAQWTVQASGGLEDSLARRQEYSAGPAAIIGHEFSQDVEIGVRRLDDMILTSVCYLDSVARLAFDGDER